MAANGGQATDASSDSHKETEDHSLLNKPINVGISGIQHVVHCLQRGTPEIRDLLLNECSLIYECKVCMSLHRSLVNFLAHKRTYCKQHLCETMMLFHAEDIEKETVIVQPEDPDSDISPAKDCLLSEIEHLEYNDQLEVGHQAPNILQPLHNSTKKVPTTARMPQPPMPALCSTEVLDSVEHLIKRRVVPSVKESAEELALELERIPSNPNAMFQRRLGDRKHEPEVNGDTNVPDEVLEADENSGSNQGYDSENNVHVDKLRGRTDCDIDTKTCLVCKTRYVSLKTLSFHMRNIHATVRTFYQCPYCEASFSQSWGVTRHLMQVHKRSRTQVTTIKPEVRRKTVNKVEDIVKDRQHFHNEKRSQSPSVVAATKTVKGGSVVKMEKASVGAFPCRKCGKSFNMKSAMAGHTSHCLRKKTKKVAATTNKVSKVAAATAEDNLPTPSPPTPPTPPPPVLSSVATRPKRLVKKRDTGDFVSGGRRVNVAQKKIERLEAPVAQPKNANKEVYTQHLQQIESIINVPKLKCLKCVRKFSSISNLRRHTAIHLGWNRYKCCHCEYQSYTRSDCRSHIKRVHTEIKSSPNELDKMVIDLFVPQPRSRPVSKRSTKAGSSSSSPEPKPGSRARRSPSLTSSPKTAKTKTASPKVVPGSRSSRKTVVEKKPQVPLRPSTTKASTDSMLTLVTRASSYMKPNMAMHLLQREKEKEKVAVRKKTKSSPNVSPGSREIKVNKGKTKAPKVNNEDDGDDEGVECKAKDSVVMEDLVIESCIVQEEHPHGCEEFVAEMMDMDATPSDLDDDWITNLCQ